MVTQNSLENIIRKNTIANNVYNLLLASCLHAKVLTDFLGR